MLHDVHDCILDIRSDVTIWFLVIRMQRIVANQYVCAQVRSEDDESIAKVYLVTLTVGQEAFV